MGGGGLRILPHKTWHVWRRDNIERVLKDEREHEEKRRDADANERSREQERRAQQLVAKGPDDQAPKKHVNLFKTEEILARCSGVTQHQRKKEKGNDETLRKHGQLPWYAQPERAQKELTASQERQNKRNLEMADPLQFMRPKEERGQRLGSESARLLGNEGCSRHKIVRTGPTGSDRRKYSGRYDYLSTSRDCKEHNRRRQAEGEEETVDTALEKCSNHRTKKSKHEICKKETMLEALRREREAREAIERRRAESLMNG